MNVTPAELHQKEIMTGTWYVVLRLAKYSRELKEMPVAAFRTMDLAKEWISEAEHRSGDRIQMVALTN